MSKGRVRYIVSITRLCDDRIEQAEIFSLSPTAIQPIVRALTEVRKKKRERDNGTYCSIPSNVTGHRS